MDTLKKVIVVPGLLEQTVIGGSVHEQKGTALKGDPRR